MRRLLLLVCSIVLVDTMLYAALVPLLPRYVDEFDLSKAGAGVLVGTYAAGALIAALPAGFAAAKYGPRRAVLLGLGLIGLASLGFGFAGDEWTLGVARFVQGVGSALSWAGALAWLVASTPKSRRGEMIGTAIGSAIFGALLGPALGALAEEIDPLPVFIGLAGLAAGLSVWAVRTPPAEAESPSVESIRRALGEPQVLCACWLMVQPALFFGVLAVLVPLELDAAGWAAAAIAAVWIGSAAVEMFVVPLLGRFSDRRGRLLPLRLALGGAVLAATGLALADRPAVLVPLVAAASIVTAAFWAPAMAMLADTADRIGLAQGLAFGLMNAAWATGNTVGPALGGALADAAGDALPYALVAVLCAATLLGLQRVGTRPVRVPENP